jgi:hypothetical protein
MNWNSTWSKHTEELLIAALQQARGMSLATIAEIEPGEISVIHKHLIKQIEEALESAGVNDY